MNNKEFITELSQRSEYTSRDVADIIFTLTQVMTEKWQNNDSIAIQNFGTFEVKKKSERISVNPVSKQRLLVPPKLVLTFRPSTLLKDKFK
ncbi:MAG: HU family DNA-binding protein [Bacteroidaceae bacterium]|nr:HU family DNA-binding protein [Bacteroidaceae bacterium]